MVGDGRINSNYSEKLDKYCVWAYILDNTIEECNLLVKLW